MNNEFKIQATINGIPKNVVVQTQVDRDTFANLVTMSNNPGGGVYVCNHVPVSVKGFDFFQAFRQKNPNMQAYVGFTAFETDSIPQSWVEPCNAMDEIWVFSTFNVETFAKAGVLREKLQAIPIGFDPDFCKPNEVKPLEFGEKKGYNFLSIFEWTFRKGWDVLIRAFIEEFEPTEDVRLIIRSYQGGGVANGRNSIQDQLIRYIQDLGYDVNDIPAIDFINEMIPLHLMPNLYKTGDAFVLPTRGEGWGIPLTEAMLMEMPVLGTRWSGQLDFMNDENSYLIDVAEIVAVSDRQVQDNPFYAGHNWANPSVEHTRKLLRHVFENREEAQEKGKIARQYVLDHFTTRHVAKKIAERLHILGSDMITTQNKRKIASQPKSKKCESPVQKNRVDSHLIWHAPLFDPSGYADEARQFVLGLDAIGMQVSAVPINWNSNRILLEGDDLTRLNKLISKQDSARSLPLISVFHIFPVNFKRIPDACYHVGRTMFETDRIPENWVAACNQMDEIWVPGDFNIESFARAGVAREKLVKIPGGINIQQFKPAIDPLEIPGKRKFNFLSVFDWSWRKGWDILLEAFVQEFGQNEDVALILKTWSSFRRPLRDLKHQAIAFLREQGVAAKLPSNIIFYQDNLPVGKLASLYKSADAFVLPTRGEGWGRPFMEAMLMGLPTIATRWSGQLEFMNDENSYLVNCVIQDVPQHGWHETRVFRGHKMAEPSLQHLRQLMRAVIENTAQAKEVGKIARELIIGNFSREKVAEKIAQRIQVIEKKLKENAKKPTQTKAVENLARAGSRSAARKKQSLPAVVWEGSQFVTHSLALINREQCLQLIDAGFELSIIPFEKDEFLPDVDSRFKRLEQRIHAQLSKPADVHIRHQWPPNFNPPETGRWVMIQPWEYGSLPKRWAEAMNREVDEFWVYSNYVRECYIRSGVDSDRVFVVPNGVDTQKFQPQTKPFLLKTKKKFKFLFVGGTIARKGIDVLLDVYGNTFTRNDNVCLVIKDMGGKSFYRGQTAHEAIAALQSVANAPEIEYIDRVLDEKQLAGLYTACDCLVHPYRGEGFGLPIIEAMSSGLPAIVTGHGAALDFCNNDNSYLISAREVRWPKKQVGNEETVDFPWWAEPDRESLRHWVKHVVANLNEAKEKGVAARAFILNHFTWQQASQILQERIHNLCLKPVRRFSDEIRWQRQLEKGEELFEKCEYEQAEQLFAGIMAENPKHVQARNNYACLLWQTGRLEQAATEFRRAFELDPNDRDLAWNAGQFLSATGFVTEAREIYSNYLSGHPQEKEMREQMQVWEVGSTCLPAQAGRADPEINPDRVPNPVRVDG